MSRRLFPTGLLCLCLCLSAGCGSDGATVSGEVTVNEQPLEKGIISYSDAEGDAAPSTAVIENGHYELQTTPGRKRVRISAPVVVRQVKESSAPDSPLIDVTEESLPDRYHVQSELTFEVEPGSNTKNWTVESRFRKR
jgi:hypothetical protein